jgi:hypothetical protein
VEIAPRLIMLSQIAGVRQSLSSGEPGKHSGFSGQYGPYSSPMKRSDRIVELVSISRQELEALIQGAVREAYAEAHRAMSSEIEADEGASSVGLPRRP